LPAKAVRGNASQKSLLFSANCEGQSHVRISTANNRGVMSPRTLFADEVN
jgi:hypothetical protein